MSYRRTVLSAANLLAHLEAASLGYVDEISEEERSQALETARKVTEIESRKWRAHRRPSPGRRRAMRGVGLPGAIFAALLGLLGLAPQGCLGEVLGGKGSRCAAVSGLLGAGAATPPFSFS
jgi:hypothetical protein